MPEYHNHQRAAEVPRPLLVTSSQYFEGNDGNWSTFNLRVGTPEQDARVLVSTSAHQSMVVLSEYGCTEEVMKIPPSSCAESRGQLFNPNASSSWQDQGTYDINRDGRGFVGNLGYKQVVEIGLENVGLGLPGKSAPTFSNQTIAAFADATPFYLGLLGLGTQPINLTTLGNTSASSYFASLKAQNYIPSLSWSYTAGAKYRLKQVFGQLVFGGYDGSRFQANNATFQLAPDQDRDIVVSIRRIVIDQPTTQDVLTEPVYAFIDSTTPFIWLPESACLLFEKTFLLKLDTASNYYLLTEEQHNSLLKMNPSITFYLSDTPDGFQNVTITLPYSAFDLQVQYPIVAQPTYYFPLRRAANETQYTLGRTFLQEAYLTVDYERRNFSVSQCSWTKESQNPTIITIPSTSTTNSISPTLTTAPSSPPTNVNFFNQSTSTLPAGTITGIVLAIVTLLAVGMLGISKFLTRRRKRVQKLETTFEGSSTEGCAEVTGDGITELSSTEIFYEICTEGNSIVNRVELE